MRLSLSLRSGLVLLGRVLVDDLARLGLARVRRVVHRLGGLLSHHAVGVVIVDVGTGGSGAGGPGGLLGLPLLLGLLPDRSRRRLLGGLSVRGRIVAEGERSDDVCCRRGRRRRRRRVGRRALVVVEGRAGRLVRAVIQILGRGTARGRRLFRSNVHGLRRWGRLDDAPAGGDDGGQPGVHERERREQRHEREREDRPDARHRGVRSRA